jgi:nucleoside 2-deoxyribosyltransferase
MRNVPVVYLAAPLFNARERKFNDELASMFAANVDVFLPQRDGELLTKLVEDGMEKHEAEGRVFGGDIQAMRSAHLLVAVLDGAHVDEGVAFEIGFMNGRGECCVGLQTDVRRALPTGNNPMIGQGLVQIFYDVSELADWIAEWSVVWRNSNLRNVA